MGILTAEEIAADLAEQFFVDCDKRHYPESKAYCELQGAEIASIHNQ